MKNLFSVESNAHKVIQEYIQIIDYFKCFFINICRSGEQFKKRANNTLKEDKRFRYVILGLLEIRDIMGVLRKLRKDFNHL